MNTIRVAPLSLAVLLLAPMASANAQAGPRWQAWIGCWSAVAPASSSSSAGEPSPTVCVTPTTDADVIEISAVSDGKVVSHDRIDASGRAHAIDAGGCTGSTRATWSGDQRRVYLHSSVTCDGQPSETSAILAMSSTGGGEWIDVRSVTSGGNSEVRVARYRDAGVPASVPAELAAALRDRGTSVRAARIASTSPIGTRDIVEASHSVDAPIVEAWLMESGQQYAADARTLRDLADAGVPSRVTDAMVNASRTQPSEQRYGGDDTRVVEHVVEHVVVAPYDPWGYGYGYYGGAYPIVRYRPAYYYAPVGFSFSLFGFGFASFGHSRALFGYYPYAYRPVAYVPFGYGFGYGNRGHSYYQPVVISRPGREHGNPRTAHPIAVHEQGYTQRRDESHHESSPRTVLQSVRSSAEPESRGRSQDSGTHERASRPAQAQSQSASHESSGGRTAHGRH